MIYKNWDYFFYIFLKLEVKTHFAPKFSLSFKGRLRVKTWASLDRFIWGFWNIEGTSFGSRVYLSKDYLGLPVCHLNSVNALLAGICAYANINMPFAFVNCLEFIFGLLFIKESKLHSYRGLSVQLIFSFLNLLYLQRL